MPSELALQEFIEERDRLNRIFEDGRISNDVYHTRLERLRYHIKEH